MSSPEPAGIKPIVVAGIILGVGLGGFVDGIVLHQVLQWHHMLSAFDHQHYPTTTVDGLEVNTLWDGLFHMATWAATVTGLGLLFRAGYKHEFDRTVAWSTPAFIGSLLAGWGLFNVVEGAVNHHLIGAHHVRDDLGGPLSWDLGFLALGMGLVIAGAVLIRLGQRR